MDNWMMKNHLTIPEQQQLNVARKTLQMNDAMIAVMGGLDGVEARKIILKLTGRPAKE